MITVGFIFRCIGSIVMLGSMIFYFLKKIMPVMQLQLAEIREKRKKRIRSIEKFKNQQLNIKLALQQQYTLLQELEEKIKKWQEYEQRKAQGEYKKSEQNQLAIHQRLKIQQKELNSYYQLRSTMPFIISSLKQQMKHEFTDTEQQKYNDTILRSLGSRHG